MGDQLLPLPLTERTVHLCVDMQRIFSPEGHVADAMDVQGLAGRRQPSRVAIPRELSPRASFRSSIPIRCRKCGSATIGAGVLRPASASISTAGLNAVAGGTLPALDRYR
jgi:hypothetical protein